MAPPADVDAFLGTVQAHAAFFDPSKPIVVARAPGRLDLMGGIADYSGSLVLQWPIAAAAFAAAQWSDDAAPAVTVRTTDAAAAHGATEVTAALGEVIGDYASVRAGFAADPARRWAAYVAGALTVLARERWISFDRGVRFLIASDVPAGKGVSSSAAIEVAAMHALCGLIGPDALPGFDAREMALLCQMVENHVVGAPCGVMDQMTAASGEAGSLLALLCQPAEVRPTVPLPDELEVFGLDSGIRHAVTGADYASVRVGAFMGLRIITELAGAPPANGYLANVTPGEWAARFRGRVPEQMTGAEFLDAYGGFADTATSIERGRVYAVRQPTAHPIHEHDRVQRFRALLLERSMTGDAPAALGALMFESHESYSACGLGSEGTDALVALVRDAGPARGLFGAKITGGGSGGTVAVLARRGSRAAVEELAARYGTTTGRPAVVISGSSDGAWRAGTLRIQPPRG
jgi:galactokinase